VPGDLLAVTGPRGAGKSTVARLLLRFRDPDAGRILLDGIDLRELSLRTLRYNVTLLTQEALLFPGTVADNIRYGRSGGSDQEVAAAALAADAHAFITALPGLRHAGRPARPPAVRRPAPADLPGPGLPPGRPGAGPGRADDRPGRGQRVALARGDPPVRGQPHGHPHHP
jgi:hypothetical protein